MSETVAVAVVVKDRVAAMTRCLEAIDRQSRIPDQIVVIDNGSSDGTWELLADRAAGDQRFTIERDTGSLGAIRNRAVQLATTELIAFTDSDCQPDDQWLRELTAHFSDPRIGVVQGRTLPCEDSTRRWAATQQIERFSGLYEACNIGYRRQALLETRGFDEQIGFFGEDTAAGWLARRAGWQVAFASDAVVRHDVTYPGVAWHFRRCGSYANWPVQVSNFPELRGELLWHGWFLNRRTAEFDLAAVGLAAALIRRDAKPLVLTLPYLRSTAASPGRRTGITGAIDAACGVAFDTARAIGLLRGSLRTRHLVL